MANYTTNDIRNLAIVGATGTGKTTLVEAMLFKAGVIGRAGRIEDGNTVCDYDDLEKEFKQSLDSTLVNLTHAEKHINIIDTPGAPDFLGKAIGALPAVETAMVVIDTTSGIDTVTRRIMKIAQERNLPRMIVVNKIDQGEDLSAFLETIQESFGTECRPVNLPVDGGKSVIDCFENTSGTSDLGDIEDHHTAIVEQVVEVDEDLMEQYLEKGEVSVDQLHDPFERSLREGHLIPICFVSAREDVGISELLDLIAKLCPSPCEGTKATFTYNNDSDPQDHVVEADQTKPTIAHVFKVSSDPFVGKLCVFRVHQGTIGSSVNPLIDEAKRPTRIAHVFKLMGKNHEEVSEIIAGDIGAVAKIDEIRTDSVLHDGSIGADLKFTTYAMPKPMYGLALEGKSKGAETKMGEALGKLVAEDRTIQLERVQATGETVLRGLGEQHLRIKLLLLKDRYGVEVDTHTPTVPYKETITAKAEGHHRHKKQSGGAGQFGEVYLRVEPISVENNGQAEGLEFVDETFGGSIPKQFLPAIEKGIKKVLAGGAIAGYPLGGVKVSVYDGKHHPVDSKEVAFMTAGRKAFIDAVQKAKPVLLEPYVSLEITVPAGMIGDISSDISGRRGRIQGTDMLPGNIAIIKAEAPLAELMTYASQLKSISAGAGSYTMEYSHDEPAPPNVQADIVAKYKPHSDDD
ncbi:MAG: elongation factor G [Planctomycetes bacterium]|nr:elongation factor G [Planctomycetota bacterium]